MAAVDDLVAKAKGHLATRAFAEAKAAIDEAFALDPRDDRGRETYQNIYLAHGIRLSALARERRRSEIEARGKPGEPFEDSPEVKAVFLEVVDAFDRVLAVNPNHAKALGLKAQALFRADRANRPAALAVYDAAAKALEATVPAGSARDTGLKNLRRDRRRIETPCSACEDTGFCSECVGSGWRTTFGFRRKCEACLGHGICKRCGVL